jgi:SAM-dependent methyltransferase
MTDDAYDALAGVYQWLVPEPLLTPEGSVAAFASVVDTLRPGARVLDCAAGTGQLAVGLALRGFDVVASDASSGMIERTRRLATDHRVDLAAVSCTWEQLGDQGWADAFDAVFCVGNSLTHAAGRAGRRAALGAMAGVLREDGLLVVTSRNWERVREKGSGLQVADNVTERDGKRGLVIHAWTVAQSWDEPHDVDVAVALLDPAGGVTTHGLRLQFWPFTRHTLDEDLHAVGLMPASSTYAHEAERYLITALRHRPPPAGQHPQTAAIRRS